MLTTEKQHLEKAQAALVDKEYDEMLENLAKFGIKI